MQNDAPSSSSGSGAMFALLAGGMAVVVLGLLYFRAEPSKPGTAPGTGPGKVDTTPAVKPSTVNKGKPEIPVEPAMVVTPENCIAFLRTKAAAPAGRPGTFSHPAVRVEALTALAALKDPGYEALLLTALGGDGDDTDFGDAHIHAAVQRIKEGRPDGKPVLDRFLASEDLYFDLEVVVRAAEAARYLGPEAGPRLILRLLADEEEELAEDEDALAGVLREAAASGTRPDRSKLLKWATDPDEEWFGEVHAAAAALLLATGDATGEKALAKALADDGFEGEEFAAGLAIPGMKAVLPWLRQLAASDDFSTRAAAARAMYIVGDPAAEPDLLAFLKDEDMDVRREAAIALLRFGDRSGLAVVRDTVANSKDVDQRALAWRALGDAVDKDSLPAATTLLGSPWATGAGSINDLMVRIWAARLYLATQP